MLGLGLELGEGVGLAALPDWLLDGAGAARAEADLLLARGEGGGVGFAGLGGAGGEGAVEVGEGGLLRGWGERGDDLADAEGGGLFLDLEDVGDGVLELLEGGVVLRGQGERFQPLGDVYGIWSC